MGATLSARMEKLSGRCDPRTFQTAKKKRHPAARGASRGCAIEPSGVVRFVAELR